MQNPNIKVPANVEAENAIIGCIFIDFQVMSELIDSLEVDDFFDSRNKELFKALKYLYDDSKVADETTILAYLNDTNKLEAIGGLDYLNKIMNFSYSVANLETYIDLVKEASLKRKTINSLERLSQTGYDSSLKASNYIEMVEETIMNLSSSKRTGDLIKITQITDEVTKQIEANAHKSGGLTGLNTLFPNLNKLTLGLQNGNLIILAARPAMGKSAFALNLAVNVALANKDAKANVAIFSLEMSTEQLVERMISSDSDISLGKLKEGNLNEKEWNQVLHTKSKLNNLNLWFDDSSLLTVEDIRSKCRKQKTNQGLDLVVIDYLQLIQGDNNLKSQQEKVSKISRYLKLMARELNIPVIALAQLSRDVEKREDKKPLMSDLRDSGSIEQDADIVMFLYREEYYNRGKRPGEADLIISKNRSGSLATLDFIFEPDKQKFVAIEKPKEN